jgi:hypothetical protein
MIVFMFLIRHGDRMVSIIQARFLDSLMLIDLRSHAAQSAISLLRNRFSCDNRGSCPALLDIERGLQPWHMLPGLP